MKLYLPRLRVEAEPLVLISGHPTEHGETVLLIDDETVVRGLIVELLRKLGYHTLEVIDGPSGLDALRSRQRIDLLITDIGLPVSMAARSSTPSAASGPT